MAGEHDLQHTIDEALFFEDGGNIISIPVARSIGDLTISIENRVVPGLNRLEASMATERGVALVPYTRQGEGLLDTDPETVRALVQAFRQAGLPAQEPDGEVTPCTPKREHLIRVMRDEAGYWSEDGFADKMWVLGPMTSNTLVQRNVWFLTKDFSSLTDDESSTKLLSDSSVAFEGSVLLDNVPDVTEDIFGRIMVCNTNAIAMLDAVFPSGALV